VTITQLADVGDIIDSIESQLSWLVDGGADERPPGAIASLRIVSERLRRAVQAYRERLPSGDAPGNPRALEELQAATGCDGLADAEQIALRVWRAVTGCEHPAQTPTLKTAALEAATRLRSRGVEVKREEPSTVPDAPGLWKLCGARVLVERHDGDLMWRDSKAGLWRGVFDVDPWGGRCTPGDAGLRARVEGEVAQLASLLHAMNADPDASEDVRLHCRATLDRAIMGIRAALESQTPTEKSP
jgi:hypothetical protein